MLFARVTRVLAAAGLLLLFPGLLVSVALTLFLLVNPDCYGARMGLTPMFLTISGAAVFFSVLLLRAATCGPRPGQPA